MNVQHKPAEGSAAWQPTITQPSTQPTMGRHRQKNGNLWRKLQNKIKARDTHCHLCGQEIDKTLPQYHPWSFEVDHIVPISAGGSQYDPANLHGAHRDCNLRKSGANRKRPHTTIKANPSRPW